MEIIPYQFTLDDKKVTTYKLNFEGYKIMLDCGSNLLKREDFMDVDYIFISHAHLDHWIGLYENYKHLKKDCKIFATLTTKKLINAIVNDFLNGETNLSSHEKKQIRSIFMNIKEKYFEEPFACGELVFTLYPAGHMFGASMLYIEGKRTFLYTGDMDYVKGNKVRSYYFDASKRIDILLIDGTKLYTDSFKKTWISEIKKDIRERKFKNYRIYVKDKTKAVFYAFELAKEFDDRKIFYEGDLSNVNNILYEQGYDIYEKNRILSIKMMKSKYPRTISITSKSQEKAKYCETKLGLHISSDDIHEFIYQYARRAKVLIGHFDLDYYDKLSNYFKNFHFLQKEKVKIS